MYIMLITKLYSLILSQNNMWRQLSKVTGQDNNHATHLIEKLNRRDSIEKYNFFSTNRRRKLNRDSI